MGIPTADKEKWFTSSVYAVLYFEKFRAAMLTFWQRTFFQILAHSVFKM